MITHSNRWQITLHLSIICPRRTWGGSRLWRDSITDECPTIVLPEGRFPLRHNYVQRLTPRWVCTCKPRLHSPDLLRNSDLGTIYTYRILWAVSPDIVPCSRQCNGRHCEYEKGNCVREGELCAYRLTVGYMSHRLKPCYSVKHW